MAGVLWIKIPENCGDILFSAPLNFSTFLEIESYTEDFKEKINYFHSYKFKPEEGKLLIFPSHLEHNVNENKSNEDRISISFNMILDNSSIDTKYM